LKTYTRFQNSGDQRKNSTFVCYIVGVEERKESRIERETGKQLEDIKIIELSIFLIQALSSLGNGSIGATLRVQNIEWSFIHATFMVVSKSVWIPFWVFTTASFDVFITEFSG
jgi:hypothetical protein